MKFEEIEIKLYISDINLLRKKVEALPVVILEPRIHEINYRYDTLDNRLSRNNQVLRLRKDKSNRITYKGPGRVSDELLIRKEIEISVDSFEAANDLLESLGFNIQMTYEKYRTTYSYQSAAISLDELPYGNFIEIEADDPDLIINISGLLGLVISASILDSYTGLFMKLCNQYGFDIRDLTFDNFRNLEINAVMLGVQPADHDPV